MTQPTEPPETPTEPPTERPAAAVGPLALEAALLLDVVADRLESMKGAPGTPVPAADGDDAGGAGAGQQEATTAGPAARCPECGSVPGASCTACPLCRFMALLRGERPEATAKLVDGALLIIRTLRSLVPDPPAAGAPGAAPPEPPPPTGRRGGLERIDIL